MLRYAVYKPLPYVQGFLPRFIEYVTPPIIALWVLRFCEMFVAKAREGGVPVMYLLEKNLSEKIIGYLFSRVILSDWFDGFMLCLCFELGCFPFYEVAGNDSQLQKTSAVTSLADLVVGSIVPGVAACLVITAGKMVMVWFGLEFTNPNFGSMPVDSSAISAFRLSFPASHNLYERYALRYGFQGRPLLSQ